MNLGTKPHELVASTSVPHAFVVSYQESQLEFNQTGWLWRETRCVARRRGGRTFLRPDCCTCALGIFRINTFTANRQPPPAASASATRRLRRAQVLPTLLGASGGASAARLFGEHLAAQVSF